MKIIFMLCSLAALFLPSLYAQNIITQWDFNTLTPGVISTAIPSTGSGSVALVGGTTTPSTGSTGLGSSDQAATNIAFQTTTYPAQGLANQSAGVQFNTSTSGYENIKLTFDLRLSNTSSRWIQVQYTANGTSWQNFGSPIRIGGMGDDNAGDAWHNENVVDFSSITTVDNNPNFGVRVVTSFSAQAFTMYNTSSSFSPNQAYEPARNPSVGVNSDYAGGTMRYDMVTFEGDQLPTNVPAIIADPTALATFNQVLGAPSSEQSFTVSASNLTAVLSLQAPASYEISLSSGSGFQSSLNLTPSAGIVASTIIYVRLNAGVEGNFTGNVALSSSGATTINVALNGISSLAPLPLIFANPTGLSGFNQTIGSASSEQSLIVTGQNLTDEVTVDAPTGYEISLSSGSGFSNALSLPQTAGSLAPTTVYVRLNHNVVGTLIADLILSNCKTSVKKIALLRSLAVIF
jgi:hypothetical protein